MSYKPVETEPFHFTNEGPWSTEPNAIKILAGDYPAVGRRGPLGHWCAYVGIPEGHKLFMKYYEAIEEMVDVHGGVTFSDFDEELDSLAGMKANYFWWIGFDCAHSGDLVPNYPVGGTYRDLSFVTHELTEMVKCL